jgi:signal transduction histidine kinase
MAWQYTPFTAPLLVAAGGIAVVALYIVRQQRAYRPVPGGYVAVLLSLAVSFTLLTYAIQLAQVGYESKLFWKQMSYIGGMSVAPLLFLFTLRYTDLGEHLTKGRVALVWVPPLVVVGIAWANNPYSLVWAELTMDSAGSWVALVNEPGIALVGYIFYAYVVVGAAIALLVKRAVDMAGIYRRQAILLVSGAAVPLVAALVYAAGLNPTPRLNVPFVAMAFPGVLYSWGVARHGLFTLAPIASQAAVEQMDDAVIVIDIRGLVVNVNEAAEPFLMVDVDDAIGSVVGDTLRSFAVPPAPDETEDESDREVVTDPETGRYYERIGTPLTDDDGVLMGQLIVLQDITERYRREKRLRQQNEQLEEFASVVSHDLRNPLNVISARTQLARETGDDEHFEALDSATARMDQLIDDLLQLARQGQTVDETKQVDLRGVAEDAWELVESPEASLEVEGEMAVEADRDRLQQALENLFRNATDHVGEDVALKLEPLDDGFAVEDDGPGIPVEEQDQVFEYGHTTEEDGTGFGLAIIREIVEAHGWEIRVMNGDMAASTRDGDGTEYGGARFEITGVSTARSFSLAAEGTEFEFG